HWTGSTHFLSQCHGSLRQELSPVGTPVIDLNRLPTCNTCASHAGEDGRSHGCTVQYSRAGGGLTTHGDPRQ
ncbi:unnamed protein product, partial [Staurois parvus]